MRKTIKLFSLMASIALSGAVSPALADDAKPASTPATPVVAVNGLVDGYYTYNFTNGANNSNGMGNKGTFFNTADEDFALGLAEVDVNVSLGNTSGHISLDYGQEANLGIGLISTSTVSSSVPVIVPAGGTTYTAPVVSVSTSTASNAFNVLQAYVSYAPDQWTFNLGRFVTWMGNEVIQSKSNWNYSRSLLFWYTIPLFHQGLSIGYAPDSKFGITGYVVNGWNNAGVPISGGPKGDGADLGKTYGLQAKFAPDSTFSVVLNGIVGPNNLSLATVNPDQTKWVGEAIISFVPNSTWSFALDAEYGSMNLGGSSPVTVNDGTTTTSNLPFWGIDLYGRYQVSSDWAVALRLEQVVDTYGFALGLYGLTPQFTVATGKGPNDVTAQDVTLTVEHNFSSNLLMRLEGRYDGATSGGTAYGPLTATSTVGIAGPFAGGAGSQATGTASMVFSF